jgi:hypothetical protein
MPLYTYKDPETGKEFTENMTITEMEIFEQANPKFERVWNPVALGDAIRLGITKPPSDFDKYVLGKIKETHPGNNIEKRRTIKREF